MNKAFTKEDEGNEVAPFRSRFQPLDPGFRNLITLAGAEKLRDDLKELQANLAADKVDEDAAHLSRDEQRRLLKLQIEDLTKRLENHEVVPPAAVSSERVIFGSTVTVRDEDGAERRYTLVGIDETDLQNARIGFTSPLARALLNQRVGSLVKMHGPKGDVELEIINIS